MQQIGSPYMEASSKIQRGISRKIGLRKTAVTIAGHGCTNTQRTNKCIQKLMTTIIAVLTNERTVISGLQLVNKKKKSVWHGTVRHNQ